MYIGPTLNITSSYLMGNLPTIQGLNPSRINLTNSKAVNLGLSATDFAWLEPLLLAGSNSNFTINLTGVTSDQVDNGLFNPFSTGNYNIFKADTHVKSVSLNNSVSLAAAKAWLDDASAARATVSLTIDTTASTFSANLDALALSKYATGGSVINDIHITDANINHVSMSYAQLNSKIDYAVLSKIDASDHVNVDLTGALSFSQFTLAESKYSNFAIANATIDYKAQKWDGATLVSHIDDQFMVSNPSVLAHINTYLGYASGGTLLGIDSLGEAIVKVPAGEGHFRLSKIGSNINITIADSYSSTQYQTPNINKDGTVDMLAGGFVFNLIVNDGRSHGQAWNELRDGLSGFVGSDNQNDFFYNNNSNVANTIRCIAFDGTGVSTKFLLSYTNTLNGVFADTTASGFFVDTGTNHTLTHYTQGPSSARLDTTFGVGGSLTDTSSTNAWTFDYADNAVFRQTGSGIEAYNLITGAQLLGPNSLSTDLSITNVTTLGDALKLATDSHINSVQLAANTALTFNAAQAYADFNGLANSDIQVAMDKVTDSGGNALILPTITSAAELITHVDTASFTYNFTDDNANVFNVVLTGTNSLSNLSTYTVTAASGTVNGSSVTGLDTFDGADQLIHLGSSGVGVDYGGVSFDTANGYKYNLWAFYSVFTAESDHGSYYVAGGYNIDNHVSSSSGGGTNITLSDTILNLANIDSLVSTLVTGNDLKGIDYKVENLGRTVQQINHWDSGDDIAYASLMKVGTTVAGSGITALLDKTDTIGTLSSLGAQISSAETYLNTLSFSHANAVKWASGGSTYVLIEGQTHQESVVKLVGVDVGDVFFDAAHHAIVHA